jgi:hypothetical protein
MRKKFRLALKIKYAADRFFSGDDLGLRWFFLWSYKLNQSSSFVADWQDFVTDCLATRSAHPKLRYTSCCNYLGLLKRYEKSLNFEYSRLLTS